MKYFVMLVLVCSAVCANAQWTTNPTPSFIWYSDGSVNIGRSTTPGAKLEVNGDLQIYPSGNAGGSGVRKVRFISGTNATIYEANSDLIWSNHDLIFNAANTSGGNTNQLVLYRNGNVGLGIGAPERTLHIKGGQTVEHATEASINYKVSAGSKVWDVGVNTNGFYFYEGNTHTYKMVLLENGNVGIGTLTPASFKLAVEGKIGAREVVVTTAAWSDYVFEDNYELPSLEKVRSYIKQNRHLPDVPSAAEVEKNGIALGEMDAILLKKIEELTLYLLQMEEKVKALEASACKH